MDLSTLLDSVMHNEEPVEHITAYRFEMMLYVALVIKKCISGAILRNLHPKVQQQLRDYNLFVFSNDNLSDYTFVSLVKPDNFNENCNRYDLIKHLGYMTPNSSTNKKYKCKYKVRLLIHFQYKTWCSTGAYLLSQIVFNKTKEEITAYFSNIMQTIDTIELPKHLDVYHKEIEFAN